MMTLAEAAGERIRQARKAKGWKLRSLGAAADLDFGYVGKIERGTEASLTVYERLATALDLTVDSLFGDHGSAPTQRSDSAGRPVKGSARGGVVRRVRRGTSRQPSQGSR